MNDQELINLWKSQEDKLNEILKINKMQFHEITKSRLQNTIGKLRKPKSIMLIIGIPYTILLYGITTVALISGGIFQALGFGTIALIMTIVVFLYIYHINLVNQISGENEINKVQMKLSSLKLSSYKCMRLTVLQLPFWVLCWISLDALIDSPLIYGGVNLVILVLFTYFSFWLYDQLSPTKSQSQVSHFFLSGGEWEPIKQSADILEQLKTMN